MKKDVAINICVALRAERIKAAPYRRRIDPSDWEGTRVDYEIRGDQALTRFVARTIRRIAQEQGPGSGFCHAVEPVVGGWRAF